MPNESARREFGDLRVALVDGEEYSVSIFKNVAASLGVHDVVSFATPKAAVANIRISGAPDMLFVKFNPGDGEALQLCRLVRDRGNFPHPFMALVAIMERATVGSVTEVRDAGADEFLACPYSPKSLVERIRSILYDRRGFVDVPGYFGPDRRRGAMAKWLGADRRGDPSELIDPVTEEIYMG